MNEPLIIDKDELCHLYETMDDREIAAKFGCHSTTIARWRRRYGIQTKCFPLGLADLTEMSKTLSDAEIGNRVGRPKRTVAWWRKKLGIPAPEWRRRHGSFPINDHYFSSIDTEEKAYFLGFLSADGYVSHKSLNCALSAVDVHILEELRTALGSNHKIGHKISRSYSGSKPQRVLHLSCKQLVVDLAQYGVVPNKSKTLAFANIPSDLERHYIRGLFDGDGHIGKRQFVMIGTEATLIGMNDAMERHGYLALTTGRFTSGHFRLTGSRRHQDTLRWIYANSTKHLNRKYQSFLEHWS